MSPDLSAFTRRKYKILSKYVSKIWIFFLSAYKAAAFAISSPNSTWLKLATVSSKSFATSALTTISLCLINSSARRLM